MLGTELYQYAHFYYCLVLSSTEPGQAIITVQFVRLLNIKYKRKSDWECSVQRCHTLQNKDSTSNMQDKPSYLLQFYDSVPAGTQVSQ